VKPEDMSSFVRPVLESVLKGIDEDTLSYFIGMLVDETGDKLQLQSEESLIESFAPFIEANGLADDSSKAEALCKEIYEKLSGQSSNSGKVVSAKADSYYDAPQLLEKVVRVGDLAKTQISESEQQTIDTLWGFDKVRSKRNEVMEMTEAGSAKYERKAMKEQRQWLKDLEDKFVGEEEDNSQISTMILPDLSGKSREKDIHVNNFNITYGGSILLQGADLRLVSGRRYGLVGRNGIGKTTLLKHMATFDIEGFPRHHRVLHVKQEVKASEESVLQVVLNSDVERAELLRREKDLLAKQQAMSASDDSASETAATSTSRAEESQLQQIADELSEIYDRMSIIGAQSAESRAAAILSGLGFSEEMQSGPTSALSGGWRMRVALCGALLIEPDFLLLDEPTNHLDLEAVLWLQEYLKSYQHTILLVSHDRAFLNEVCTDIILFKNLKLIYYRGNYDLFESTRKEAMLVQQRQHEAQMVKVQHMQEFVDKFRYNAKRASLVQSRIKAIEREVVVEAPEEEEKGFSFQFEDCGQLGRPVIQIEGVTFGYGDAPLFKNVHLGIEQSSRVALVGPNGAGEHSTLCCSILSHTQTHTHKHTHITHTHHTHTHAHTRYEI